LSSLTAVTILKGKTLTVRLGIVLGQ